MIRKVVARRRLDEPESDVEFWRSRPAALVVCLMRKKSPSFADAVSVSASHRVSRRWDLRGR